MSTASSSSSPTKAARPSTLRRAFVRFALQASIWATLSLAIAGMLVLGGGPFDWPSALRFSATNWMPWALVTPVVFWASGRFPVVRGRLARSVPVHVAACIACTFGVSWFTLRVPMEFARPAKRVLEFRQRDHAGGPSFAFEQGGVTVVTGGAFATGVLDSMGPMIGAAGGGGRISLAAPGHAGHVVALGRDVDGQPPGFPPPPPNFSMATPAQGVMQANEGPAMEWKMLLIPIALRANVGFAVYLIIAAAAHAMAFYRQAQERERQSLALTASRNQAKLEALRLQLQPHFLFNTLNAISTLVHRDAAAADDLIGDLSDLLRVSLQTNTNEVTLARELELLEHYVAIEQARLGDRLRVVRDIDPASLPAHVPTLILQPLAENAVRHGIEPRLAPGTLTLRTRRDGDLLRLIVADDGVGLIGTRRRGGCHGIGLTNGKERLHTLHGERASLEIQSPASGGVRVEVTLPFRTAPSTPSYPTLPVS